MDNAEKYYMYKLKLKKQSTTLFHISIVILILHIDFLILSINLNEGISGEPVLTLKGYNFFSYKTMTIILSIFIIFIIIFSRVIMKKVTNDDINSIPKLLTIGEVTYVFFCGITYLILMICILFFAVICLATLF